MSSDCISSVSYPMNLRRPWGYRPVGMKPLKRLFRAGLRVEDGDAVIVGVGDVQRFTIRRQGQSVRRAALRTSGNRLVTIVSVTMPRRMLRTLTQLLEAQATNSRSSLGCTIFV